MPTHPDSDDDLLEVLFEAVPMGVTVTRFPTDDPQEGYLVAANSAADQILGFPISTFIGNVMATDGVDDNFDETDANDNQRLLYDIALGIKAPVYDTFEVEQGPARGHYRSAILPLKGRRAASIFRRIDAEVVAERALKWAMESLEASNADLDRFASTIAHDLKNPLTGISGYAQQLQQQRSTLPESAHQPADRIVELVGLADEMIDGLLDHAKRPVQTSEPIVSLDDVRAWVESLLAEQLASTGTTLHSVPLPDVRGHEAVLRQVMLNLVTNSLRYRHPDRGLHITITSTRHHRDSTVDQMIIEFVDNGLGIPASDRERVFDWGFRGERRDSHVGSGIGLAASRTVLTSMGADIYVADPPADGGTNITISIPAAN